ncbi:hypothetical protein B0H10DRAFT_2440008 [Mycena sp. CBHHK59/15]|nr:hypothetical protein B0H10DRAFT_2440008 [Mycena sp. CBHHK59/15]
MKGEVDIDMSEFPSCFYADGDYDPEDTSKGLPPSVDRPGVRHTASHDIPRACNARAHKTFTFIPEMLGYACAQGRTMISTSEWTRMDGLFDYEEMFSAVMAVLIRDLQSLVLVPVTPTFFAGYRFTRIIALITHNILTRNELLRPIIVLAAFQGPDISGDVAAMAGVCLYVASPASTARGSPLSRTPCDVRRVMQTLRQNDATTVTSPRYHHPLIPLHTRPIPIYQACSWHTTHPFPSYPLAQTMLAFLIKTIFVLLLVAAAGAWFSTELRAKLYRMAVKLYAKHAEEEEVDNLRKNIGLSKEDVQMGELLDEKANIASGQTNPLDSLRGDLKL